MYVFFYEFICGKVSEVIDEGWYHVDDVFISAFRGTGFYERYLYMLNYIQLTLFFTLVVFFSFLLFIVIILHDVLI